MRRVIGVNKVSPIEQNKYYIGRSMFVPCAYIHSAHSQQGRDENF